MHEHKFPASDEPTASVSDRAVTALQYEEQAGLGYRRRRHGAGDPYGHPDEYGVDRDITTFQAVGNVLAGLAAACGAGAFVYRPLMLGLLAVVLALVGVIAGGPAVKTARIALIIACFGFFFGMLFSIWLDNPVI